MSGPNRSSAVMQQRSEPHDSLDDFPTPPWATRALCKHVIDHQELSHQSVWEPACNRGYMARPLREYFARVHASDIHDYDWDGQDCVVDFLFPGSEPSHIAAKGVDWIITNPPFRLAEQFIQRAIGIANVGVAVIVRSAFLEGKARYENLFKDTPPNIIAQFCERVPMVKGRYDPNIASATAYSWLVWFKAVPATEPVFVWIPPCKKQLEKETDSLGGG